MTPKSFVALGFTLLLLAGACSSRPSTSESQGTAPSPQEESSGKKDPKATKAHEVETDGDEAEGSGGGHSVVGGGSGSGGSKSGGGSGGKSGGSGSTSEGETAAYPAAGTYTYKQSGFEEFCQTTECNRDELPPEQPIKVSYKQRSESGAVVVSEARASHSRVARTTYKFTGKKALITEVFTRFQYEGFEFSDTYKPDPPIEALRFPLRSGMKWSGEWKDKTSGDYSISVGDEETVSVAGSNVRAIRIETEITFRGQFDGKSLATVWYDPATKTVVKSEGKLDVKSAFGRYNTEFQTTLSSGPGY